MAAKSLETVDRDFQDAKERAEKWSDTDPERARNLLSEAEAARARGYREYAEEQTSVAKAATLTAAKGTLIAKYPRADPNAITGDSPEAMEAAAKASHEFIDKQVSDAQKAAQAARRVTTREAWTGTRSGTVGLPGGETVLQPTATEEQRNKAYQNTAEILGNARLPGPMRRYSPDNMQAVPSAGDPEMAAWQDYKVLHPDSGITYEAFRARNAGQATLVERDSGVPASEDKRG